ncbi:MAG: CpXC domain-containing protein [Anaerolineae bacterium]|nr:CpXC domain-containing protein [Anaerolineae bacterium]
MAYYARVTCPACRTQFQVPVEQILDVRVNPAVKGRLINGAVNMAVCPACGMAAGLNLPFIYHDPEKEVALLYLPIESGKTEVERQQSAGTLTRQLMDALPMEERKGYLLQPETFINLETLIRRVLEIEGVTEEDMLRSRAKQEFLGALLEAPQEDWEKLLAEKPEMVDKSFLSLLEYTSRMIASAAGEESDDFKRVAALYDYLVAHHPVAQELSARAKAVEPFFTEPSRESLLQALVNAPDDEAVAMLVESGLSLMDYAFFQQLLKQIEAAGDEAEKARLAAIRQKVLDVRQEIMAASQDLMKARMALLAKMLNTEDPLKMARSHLSELDEAFSYVLQDRIQQATHDGNQEALQALNRLVQTIEYLLEESMPPEVALARRLLMAPSEAEVDALLEKNKKLLQEPFFKLVDTLEQQSRGNGETEAADRLAQILVRARTFTTAAPASAAPSLDAQAGEQSTPSGLIISTRK